LGNSDLKFWLARMDESGRRIYWPTARATLEKVFVAKTQKNLWRKWNPRGGRRFCLVYFGSLQNYGWTFT